ncbi:MULTISPECIES: 2-keto-3-deoxygluconate permease [Bordetella]|uniref:2-keto-3-deoxygluconate permease n=1 Tax=Bordetella TaxID=517 RepID=UPI00045B1414|nr:MULTISPECIES: 2-keto-3-deoxygluconate permease [Bordetella]AOB26479.1 2-keto-3-deoxygluconate permease [Bordetella bronchiseptica]ARP76154.1 2-keto-3-deoxygluconate permease [Bordetella genomosp. 6]AZW43782.1 2-keto-3-deoxygluconate permease [Bordetella bronchiseptica]KCV66893.1 putative 2-keto-3-deoxygluconate transporter [Bordetella bronchiseptica 99-R-0433]
MTTEVSRVPFYSTMMKVPGGLMLLPLILGSLLGTFAPDALAIGGFTTALFKNSALPLIALLIFATGTQVNMRTGGPILATAGTILLMKTLVPATLIILLGHFVGLDGVMGISILAMLAAFDNSNGGLWLAYTGQYGDSRDRGAYVASAVNDGPFFSLLFLGASGLADIPTIALVAALVPFLLGVVVGNLDIEWRNVLKPVPNIVIPFFAFALGTGINLGAVISGGMSGLVLGLLISPITGALVYFGYRYILRRGGKSGLGFAAGTTAGNAIATPAVVAAADPSFQPYVATATAQVAACVLISSILAPVLASYFLKRAGELKPVDQEPQDERAGQPAEVSL